MKEIDCRGLECPAPVITTKKALEESRGSPVRVLLDNGAARENVLRFCNTKGYTVSETEGDDCSLLIISSNCQPRSIEYPASTSSAAVVLVASDRLGSGSDELGRLLLKNFLITLLELRQLPEKIFFMNSGVLLTTEGSELLEPLDKLSDSGVEILSCGVCLDYYGVREKLAAGTVTNMFSITEALLSSGNVVRI